MATQYLSSTETTNFARLSRVVVGVCCDLIRSVLEAKLPPPGLTAMLQSEQSHLCKTLEPRQREILYPSGGVFSDTLEVLDFSILYKLVRNLQGINITPHQNGWGKTPDNTDRTLSANIDRLRIERNEAYGHLSTASLSDTDFNDRWGIIRQNVLEIERDALTGDTYVKAVDALLTMSMDPDTEKDYIEELDKHYKADSEVRAIALRIEATHETMATAIRDVATRQEGMATDISDVITRQEGMATNISDVATRQEAMATNISDVTIRLETITRDIHIIKEIHPDLVPMIETTKAMITEEVKKRFIDTKAFRDSKEMIQKNRVVVIKGNTGDGKTCTVIQLLHWLSQEPGRQPLQLYQMKHFDLIAPKSKIITFVDDIFGDLCEREVQKWNKRISSVMPKLCGNDSEANFLLITVRNEVFNLHKHSFEQFQDNIIDMSSSIYNVSEEKFELLEHYQPKAKDCQFLWAKTEKEEIVTCAPNIGFPQCCRLFRDIPELQKERVKFFEKPFRYLNAALSKLQGCPALLYLFFSDGMIRVNDLDPNSTQINETLLKEAFEINLTDGDDDRTTLTYKKKVEFVKKSLDTLLGFLVVKEKDWFDDEVYRFYHDSIYVAVALLYWKSTPIGYIQNSPCKSLSYITTSKTSPNMIVISSDHYTHITHMCERLLREFECEENDYGTTIGSLDVWNDRVFVERFVRLLNDRNVDKCALLNKACSAGAEECALYLLRQGGVKPDKDTPFCVVEGGSEKVLKTIVNDLNDEIQLAVLNKACYSGSEECALYLLCECVKPDKDTPFCVVEGRCVKVLRELLQYDVTVTAKNDNNDNVLQEACSCKNEEMVTMLCDTHPQLVHGTDWSGQTALHVVAGRGICSMFQTVERTVLKSLCKVEDEQHKCETVDDRYVHRSCACLS